MSLDRVMRKLYAKYGKPLYMRLPPKGATMTVEEELRDIAYSIATRDYVEGKATEPKETIEWKAADALAASEKVLETIGQSSCPHHACYIETCERCSAFRSLRLALDPKGSTGATDHE